jgi:putative transposase
MLRLMREHHLVVPPHRRLHAKRTPSHSTPKPRKPHEWWGSERTTVPGQGVGWAYIGVGVAW